MNINLVKLWMRKAVLVFEFRGVRFHDYVGRSVSGVLLQKGRTLLKFGFSLIAVNPVVMVRETSRLRKMRGVFAGKEALVVGLGPSSGRLNAKKIAALQKNGLVVFAVNRFNLLDIATKVAPDYQVLADPFFFGDSIEDGCVDFRNFWMHLAESSGTVILVPVGVSVPREIDPARILRFNNRGLEDISKNIDPLRPRGYMSMTAYSAMAIACFFGFEKIYISGIENSQFRSVSTDRKTGTVGLCGGTHAYGCGVKEFRALPYFRDGVKAFLEDASRLFAHLEMFPSERIANIDVESIIDCFEVVDRGDLLRFVDA